MSTELAIAESRSVEPDSDESVARIEAMASELPSLIEAGDTETIKRWRDEGKAASLAAKQLGYEREAIALARQAIRCSAALGTVEVRAGAWDTTRGALAAAMDRGRLEQALDDAGSSANEARVARSVVQLGLSRVPRARFAALIRKHVAERGTTLAAASRDMGKPRTYLSTVVRKTPTAEWWASRRIADALGFDITALPPAPLPRRRFTRNAPAKWLTHRFREGDGRWDEAATRWYAFRDEVRRCGLDSPQLYEAMHMVSDILQREIRAGA